jgi:hypothetical protein
MTLFQHFMGRQPYGPSMADEGQQYGRMPSFSAHTGGGMQPMPAFSANTGGGLPAMAQGFPSAQMSGGLPPMQAGITANTGGYDAPQPMGAHTGGGFQPQQGLPPYASQIAQAHMPPGGFMPPGLAGFFNSASDRGTHNGRALAFGNNQRFTDSRALRGVPDYADRAYR